MEKYRILKTIAPALYGGVYLAEHKLTKQYVAIKKIQLKAAKSQLSLELGFKIDENAFFERKVYHQLQQKQLKHPHILQLIEDFEEDGYLYLVFEYCTNGELYDTVLEAGQLSLYQAQKYFTEIVEAVYFLHCNGFAHRDISLENVLVDKNNHCKLCDFGLACGIDTKPSNRVGKEYYLAPEVYACTPYDPAQADMWSLGILLFILLTGIPPFEKPTVEDSRFLFIQKHGIVKLIKAWKMQYLFTDEILDILDSLLQNDPLKRMTIEQLRQHSFIQSIHQTEPYMKESTILLYQFAKTIGSLNIQPTCPLNL